MKRIDEAELLAWLDGELTPERRAEIQRQLETDWELRTTLAQLERRIGKYVEATAHQSPAEIEPFDDFWLRLTPQLDRLTTPQALSRKPVRPVFFARLANAMKPQQYGWRLASVTAFALLLTTGLILYLSLSTRVRPVSAEELLQRSISGEDLRLKQLSEPVVYRKLQVKRVGTGEPVAWESWNDPQRNQFRQRVADKHGLRFLRADEKETPTVIAELGQILRANHFDPQHPLSAAAFAAWRKSIRTKSETVSERALLGNKNNDGLTLTTMAQEPYAVNAITTASLVVRKSDWHAVALHLKVQRENEIREYELRETAYEVLPLQALTVFTDLVPTPVASAMPTPAPSIVAATASPSLMPSVSLPTTAALQVAEVAALYALHQVQADLGEQLEVVREQDRQVVVRGLVQTAARKAELVQALSSIALVRPQIQTVEEATQQAAQAAILSASDELVITTNASNVATETTGQQAAAVNPLQQKLIESFGGRAGLSEAEQQKVNRKVWQFYNAVEADASAAMSAAWALRRLQERFASAASNELDETSRAHLAEMQRNHIGRLRQRARNLQTRLRPLLTAFAGEIPAVPFATEAPRATQILAAFHSIEQLGQLTDQLISGQPSSTIPQTARAWLVEHMRLETVLATLEKH